MNRDGRIDEDSAALRAIHERWTERRNRKEWQADQCFICRFFIPLEPPLGHDYGACTNALSPFDGRVMFEHDACDAFERNVSYTDLPTG
jgi:hypothetical protein